MVSLFGGGGGRGVHGGSKRPRLSSPPPPNPIYKLLHSHVHIHACTKSTLTCTDHHSNMLNATARLAIRIRYLPDFPFEWTDTNPQRSRQTLTIDDFLPSSVDAMKLQQSAAQYLMSFLVENFTDLADLQCYVPPMESIHPSQKSEVVPMKIPFKDEKLKSDTIDILTQLMEDSNIDGTPQVCTYSNRHLKQYTMHVLLLISHTCTHAYTHAHTYMNTQQESRQLETN